MIVEKIKQVKPDYSEGSGPYEIVILGLNIDGSFIEFGKYYNGPHMVSEHYEIMEKMEAFIDECVKRFED